MTNDVPMSEAELLQAVLDARLGEIHTALPGRVVSYNSANQTATIQPVGHDDIPQIYNVPVIWPRCGSAYIVMPMATGDTGLVIFCERDIQAWRRGATEGASGDVAQHSVSNAVFVPGLATKSNVVTPLANAIVIAASKIVIGSAAATESVIKGDSFLSALGSIITVWEAFNDAVDPVAAVPLNEALSAFKLAFSTYKSTKVKVD